MLRQLLRVVRSGIGGLVATLADLATLTLLVRLFDVSPRVASVPALLAGNVVMFFAQKLAFEAKGGDVRRELVRFALVQAGGFVLTAALYDAALAVVPGASASYVLTRLVVTNLVWLGYSFPLWRWVFRARPAD
ncbi:MAG TPA: GtrA family protein [Polyangiaceae bacterium]